MASGGNFQMENNTATANLGNAIFLFEKGIDTPEEYDWKKYVLYADTKGKHVNNNASKLHFFSTGGGYRMENFSYFMQKISFEGPSRPIAIQTFFYRRYSNMARLHIPAETWRLRANHYTPVYLFIWSSFSPYLRVDRVTRAFTAGEFNSLVFYSFICWFPLESFDFSRRFAFVNTRSLWIFLLFFVCVCVYVQTISNLFFCCIFGNTMRNKRTVEYNLKLFQHKKGMGWNK